MKKKKNNFNLVTFCWICKKLIYDDDEKVRDHCHVTEKFRDAGHWSSKNLELLKQKGAYPHEYMDSF